MALSEDKVIDLLVEEYRFVRAEIRMYVEQYSPRFSIFAVFVLSALAFAFENPKYDVIYTIIPIFVFVILFLTIAQTHLIMSLATRARNIEYEIQAMNKGNPILKWESLYVLSLVVPPIIKLKLKGKNVRSQITAINPILYPRS
ncbi:MAG: hypothetical protein FJ320_05440 [SAR202 cluster bacterium]|nr:hypothetical protein [SAR202 cluster bacterium]